MERFELIVEIRCGSHLYGTATPESDTDVKGVYLPGAADILLQRVRPTVSLGPAKAGGARNMASNVDTEYFSLDRYLALLAAGRTIALDMLFAPADAVLQPPSEVWLEIRRNADRLVTRRAAPSSATPGGRRSSSGSRVRASRRPAGSWSC